MPSLFSQRIERDSRVTVTSVQPNSMAKRYGWYHPGDTGTVLCVAGSGFDEALVHFSFQRGSKWVPVKNLELRRDA